MTMMQRLRAQTMAVAFVAVAAAAAMSAPARAASDKDIVDTAVGAGQFTTLVTAVKAAGLVETLKGKGPFTVFAPTDAAFAKIPKDQLDALLKDKAKLTKVLTYHVVPGTVLAKDVKPGPTKGRRAPHDVQYCGSAQQQAGPSWRTAPSTSTRDHPAHRRPAAPAVRPRVRKVRRQSRD